MILQMPPKHDLVFCHYSQLLQEGKALTGGGLLCQVIARGIGTAYSLTYPWFPTTPLPVY